MKFKKWIREMMLGSLLSFMVTVPVMVDNINSGSPPPRENFRGLVVPVRIAVLEVTVGKFTTLRIPKLPVWFLLQRTGMTVLLMIRGQFQMFLSVRRNQVRILLDTLSLIMETG